jgi:hypothetical protein
MMRGEAGSHWLLNHAMETERVKFPGQKTVDFFYETVGNA